MRTVSLGTTGTDVPAVISGMMRIDDPGTVSDDRIRELYRAARDSGVTFFDHADIYGAGHPQGGFHHCERRFGDALRLNPAERGEITLQSKTGIREGYYDSSYGHIVSSVEEALTALRTDYLDVLLIHRPDALVDPDEVARAFDHLESSGKVRHFGVSNHTPRQIDLLQRSLNQPLVVNQLQLSLAHAPALTQGLAANTAGHPDAVTVDGGGVVDYCRLHGITVQAWSPFQAPRRADGHGGSFLGSPDYPELNVELDRLAQKHDVSPAAVATAWLTRHPAGMQVVLGTTDPAHLVDAAAGADVRLDRADWYGLLRATGFVLP